MNGSIFDVQAPGDKGQEFLDVYPSFVENIDTLSPGCGPLGPPVLNPIV